MAVSVGKYSAPFEAADSRHWLRGLNLGKNWKQIGRTWNCGCLGKSITMRTHMGRVVMFVSRAFPSKTGKEN